MRFCYLNKGEKDFWLPRLFDLFYENMQTVAPLELPYEQEKAQWLAEVSPALDKEPRQIILCFVDDCLTGYLQYYIRERMLMVEELQLKREYQRTFLFFRLCQYLLAALPEDLETVEAYAHKPNQNSQKIMRRLGMELREEDASLPYLVHLTGDAQKVKKFFER